VLFLNSVAKYEIPTQPGQTQNATITGLLPAGFSAVPSEMIDENQKEQNQYGHVVWRHDVSSDQFFSLAGYFRHTQAKFKTDPLNVLAYVPDETEPFSAGSQDRRAYSGGLRLDYTYVHSKEHLIKTGFQFDRTEAFNKTMLSTFLDDGSGNPTGGVIELNADNRLVGYRRSSGCRISGVRTTSGPSISDYAGISCSTSAAKGRSARASG